MCLLRDSLSWSQSRDSCWWQIGVQELSDWCFFPKCASGGRALQAVLEEAGTARKVFGGERKETGVHVEVARQRQVGMQGVHQGEREA